MKNAPATYWFSLKPYVYPVVKDTNVLLLNTRDMNAIISNNDPTVAGLIRELLVPAAFGVVKFQKNRKPTGKKKRLLKKFVVIIWEHFP